jgi:hypothetical protein
MSPQPLSPSADIQRLRDEGYGVDFKSDHLIVSTPYVTSQRTVAWGYLISSIETAGDQTVQPDIHTVYFKGQSIDDYPCDSSGARLDDLIHQENPPSLGEGLEVTCGFSRKPFENGVGRDYSDYFEKMTTYVGLLQAEAQEIDPDISYRNFPPVPTAEAESVFRYNDAATTRARIGAVVDKVKGQRIAIVGLGGSGSYVLDAVAKSPVAEIHLFDGDVMLTHNAFRTPGALSIEQLNARPLKVEHHRSVYDAIHRHVISHPQHITAANTSDLVGFDFVFISIDASPEKLAMLEVLEQNHIPFVDTGMGLYQVDESIAGQLRTSTSNPKQANPAWLNEELSFVDDLDNAYGQNIQIAELNMLNAAMAVIAWKKYFGFYADLDHERESIYVIDGNRLYNEVENAN